MNSRYPTARGHLSVGAHVLTEYESADSEDGFVR